MSKIIEHFGGHKRYFITALLFMIPMMILIIFSQMTMEIYAYNFIVRTNFEQNTIKTVYSDNEITDEETTTQKKKIEVTSSVIFFIRPMKGGITTSCFGDSVDRATKHQGHDWAVETGTKVRAAADGFVEKAYFSESYGYNVLLRHDNGMETRYAHLSKLKVTAGQYVKQKDVIGLSGTTGDSTGPHLHFEVIKDGKRVDPMKYVREY